MEEKQSFQSHYTLDLETYKEFSKGYVGARKGMMVFLGIFVLCCLGELVAKNYGYIFLFGGLWIFLIVLAKVAGRSKIQYNRSLVANGGKALHHTVTVNDTGIVIVEDGGNKNTYQFEQILGLNETENLLILRLKYNLGIIVHKKTLTGGTQEELVSYLYQKCPNLKPKKIVKNTAARIIQNIMLGVIAGIVFFAIVLLTMEKGTMLHWEKVLTEEYEVERTQTYVGQKKIDVIRAEKEEPLTSVFLYVFSNKKEAKENLEAWADLELELEEEEREKEEFALEDRKNPTYVIDLEETVMLIQKENFVFYGICNEQDETELENIARRLGF